MDVEQGMKRLMTLVTSSITCKKLLSKNGMFQSSPLGLKSIVILQIIFIQISIHSVTGNQNCYAIIIIIIVILSILCLIYVTTLLMKRIKYYLVMNSPFHRNSETYLLEKERFILPLQLHL